MKFKLNKKNLLIGIAGLSATLIIHFLLIGNTVYFSKSEINEFGNPQNTLVVTPLLTANAYKSGGFYDYYKGKCKEECLTVTIDEGMPYKYSASENAIQVLKSLKYQFITDYQIHQDPSILKQYDKVILLHSEYVTGEIFDAVTSHKNVIYLYPNALYAQVAIKDGSMTLIRGHNYENNQYPVDVSNGFGWIYDNKDQEYDNQCKDWQFIKINNGYQLNCYPEKLILKDKNLAKTLYKITTKPIHCILGEFVTWPETCKSLK